MIHIINSAIRLNLNGRLFKRDIHDVKADWFGSAENGDTWVEKELFKGKAKAEINREYLCSFKGAVTNTVWEIKPEHYAYDPGVGPVAIALDLRLHRSNCCSVCSHL